jgi:hypothetical protein
MSRKHRAIAKTMSNPSAGTSSLLWVAAVTAVVVVTVIVVQKVAA